MKDKLCIFGDGDIQLRLFDDVKQYLIQNPPVVRMGRQCQGDFQTDVVQAQSPRFDIIVVKRYVPKLEFMTCPQYHVQITNHETNNSCNHRGTIAKMMYDLLTQRQIKVRQK